jgi:signal transduction histidine kinase/CheY-like chemotaxis protein
MCHHLFMAKRWFLVLTLALLLVPTLVGAETEHRNVLLLNSYHSGYRWTDSVTTAVNEVLGNRSDLHLYVEYMDTKRWSDASHFQHYLRLLRYKYQEAGGTGLPLEVVISFDDHALDFALHYRNELFPGVPIVFGGINDFQPSRIAGAELVTGVNDVYDFGHTMDVILDLHPGTKRFIVIGDETKSGLAGLARMSRHKDRLADQVEFEVLLEVPIKEAEARLSALGPGDVVLYLALLRTRDNRTFTLEESRRIVADASPVPVYCFWDFIGGNGLVGGHGFDAYEHGLAVAGLAERILNGEDVRKIPVQMREPNPWEFDYSALQRFHLDVDDLPPGALVVGVPTTFYRRNWPWLWGIAIFLLLEALLVAGYLVSRSKRRRLEDQLRHAQKMEAVGRLAGGIAHDFRNQLTVIEGYCDLLGRKLPESAELRRLLDRITTASRRSTVLTSKLLTFSRKHNLQPETVDLVKVVIDMDQTIRLVTGPEISLTLDAEPASALIWLDRDQLEQALLNLVTNARDAMPSGGHLSVRIRDAARGEAVEGISTGISSRGYVVLEITDTGEGMSDDVRARIFEPFYSTKEAGKGTGLGLSMVYGFVQQSGGDIHVVSQPGEGTTFTILLPVMTPETASAGAQAQDGEATAQAGTVLVVDDEEPVREFIVESLQHLGFTVLHTSDPREAVTIATSRDGIDLLITDVEMPAMSGPDLADLLGKHFPHLPVLFISGYTRLMDGDVALDENRFLTKPFSVDVLAAKVREVLRETGESPTLPRP